MIETSDRKLFRSPFPSGQPPKTPGSSLDVGQAQKSPGSSSSIANAETQEMPSFSSASFRDSSITDAKTQKIFSFPFIRSYIRSSASGQKKTRRGQISKRRKMLLMVLTGALLVPSFLVI